MVVIDSDKIVLNETRPVSGSMTTNANCMISNNGTANQQTTTIRNDANCGNSNNIILAQTNKQPIKRYYIDELGFYRYLDAEERQYVCSNVSFIERKNSLPSNGNANNNNSNNHNDIRKSISKGVGGGGGGGETRLEMCYKTTRQVLGISHFDKTEEYEAWKSGWDEFMRVKLISQQPVTLNRELKTRVRSGIPHDYRCKVWTALIRMRTRNIRAQFGDDIYQVIIRDYVSRVAVPDYATDDQNNNFASSSGDIAKNSSTLSPPPPVQNPSNSNSGKATRPNGSSYIASMSGGGGANSRTLRDSNNLQWQQQQQQQQQQQESIKSQSLIVQDQQMDKCFKQIELDLLRTLPNNRHFEDPNSIGIQRVRRVLRAYACFNQAVGYCQGMNRLAAMALLVLPEEEAFWCLVAIIQCIMPKDYYLKPWLAQVDCCVLSDLLEKKMPKLHKHLVNNDIQLTLFTWFFTIFVDGFRPELMLRIWDCFLLEGDKVLFRFALSILYITQDDLLQMADFSTMSTHLSRLVSTRKLDVEHLFETFNTMNPLSSGTIETKRDFHRNKIRASLEN